MEKKEAVNLDEILKLLFNVSNPLVIRLVNYFFHESYDANQECKVDFPNTESIGVDLGLLRSDLLIQVESAPVFHIEFQLNSSQNMAIRMFQYGFREIIKSNRDKENADILWFPKQTVLYLEEGKGVYDDLSLRIVFPMTEIGELVVPYKVPVKKAWEIGKEEKIEKGLYSLLPLEIFKLRRKLEQIKSADEEESSRLSKEIRSATIEIVDIAKGLLNKKAMNDEDYRKIITATTYLFEFLTRNYTDKKIEKEVSEIMESIFFKGKDEGRQEGILLAAQKMLEKGLNVELICDIMDLPKATVEELKKKIVN